MIKLLIILGTLIPFIGASQSISTQSKKEIGQYMAVKISRSIQDETDTSYYLSYQKAQYLYISNISFNILQRQELVELADGIQTVDSIPYDKDKETTLTLSNGMTLTKIKGVVLWLSICDKNIDCAHIQMKYARRMQQDIYN